MNAAGTRLVLALVGTDHHPFDRLVDLMDAAAVRHPEHRFVVQHGATRSPLVAEGRDYLPHDELLELFEQADVVVCHGGPATIMDARSRGHAPICVPRDPARGEHVDGHQQAFARQAGRSGLVRLTETVEELEDALVDGLVGHSHVQGAHGAAIEVDVETARHRAGLELDELMTARPRRRDVLRRLPGRR